MLWYKVRKLAFRSKLWRDFEVDGLSTRKSFTRLALLIREETCDPSCNLFAHFHICLFHVILQLLLLHLPHHKILKRQTFTEMPQLLDKSNYSTLYFKFSIAFSIGLLLHQEAVFKDTCISVLDIDLISIDRIRSEFRIFHIFEFFIHCILQRNDLIVELYY